MLLNSSRSTFVLSSHILFIIQDQKFVSTWGSAVHGFPLHHLAFIEVELNFMAYMQGCSTASSEDMTKKQIQSDCSHSFPFDMQIGYLMLRARLPVEDQTHSWSSTIMQSSDMPVTSWLGILMHVYR